MTDIAVPVAPRIIAKGVLRKVTGDIPAAVSISVDVARGSLQGIEGDTEQYVLIEDAVYSQEPRFRVATDGRWSVELVHAPGVVYRLSCPRWMQTVYLHCDAFAAGSVVRYSQMATSPGGDTPVEYVTLQTVIASIDGKVATAVGEVANGIGAAIAGYLEDNPSLIADPAAAAAASRVPRFDVVLDFGADRTGATSAVPAVEAALAAANAAPGGIVFFPPGTYDLRAGLTTSITSSGVSIQGAGRTLTTLLVKSGSLFRWDGGPRDGGCSDMRIYCPTAPDTSSIILEVVTGTRQTFERLVVDNSYRILRCGIGTTHGCSQPTIVDVRGYTANVAGATAFDFVSGSVLTMRDVVVFANCGFPQNATDSHPAAAGTTGVRFGRGAWDTIVIQNLDLNRYDIDFDVTAVGGVGVSNAWLTDCVFDYAKTAAARFVTGGAGAGIRSWYVKGCWGVATDGHSWLVDSQVSATQIRHLHFTDCVGRQSGQNNWRFIGANSDGIEVLNCHGMGANRLAASNSGSAQDDLVILGGGVHVTGGWYGEDGAPYVGFTNQARYGVNISPDLPSVSILDVRAEG